MKPPSITYAVLATLVTLLGFFVLGTGPILAWLMDLPLFSPPLPPDFNPDLHETMIVTSIVLVLIIITRALWRRYARQRSEYTTLFGD